MPVCKLPSNKAYMEIIHWISLSCCVVKNPEIDLRPHLNLKPLLYMMWQHYEQGKVEISISYANSKKMNTGSTSYRRMFFRFKIIPILLYFETIHLSLTRSCVATSYMCRVLRYDESMFLGLAVVHRIGIRILVEYNLCTLKDHLFRLIVTLLSLFRFVASPSCSRW